MFLSTKSPTAAEKKNKDLCSDVSSNGTLSDNPDTPHDQPDGPSDREGTPNYEPFEKLIDGLTSLQHDAERSWRHIGDRLGELEPTNTKSARNLIHYLSLRRHDVRELQNQLARHGISSLGRSESHVMSNLNKVAKLLHRIVNRPYEPSSEHESAICLDEGTEILVRRTAALLGPKPVHRKVRIMVTLPGEAADDYALVRDLIAGGMDCARINCAHDTPDVWERMVNNISEAKKETGLECVVCIDIAGPKLRTGAFEPGPRVLKLRPTRDVLGRVLLPARVWVTTKEAPVPTPSDAFAQLVFPNAFVQQLRVGDEVSFRDARNSRRRLKVTGKSSAGVWMETNKTAYVVPTTEFKIETSGKDRTRALTARSECIGAREQFAHLSVGDTLIHTPRLRRS